MFEVCLSRLPIVKTSTIIFILESIISRDIAARNCIIEPSSLRVRLADAALARDLFPQDYHCLGDNENRPIRWMALESLQRNEYSTATDVVRSQFIHADKSKLRYFFSANKCIKHGFLWINTYVPANNEISNYFYRKS